MTEPTDRAPMTMDEIARLPTLKDQLEALNDFKPVDKLSVEECHVVHAIIEAWGRTMAWHGAPPDRDILRSLLHAGFQVLRPYATPEQEALGTVDTTLPN